MMRGNTFLGAFEIYYDITARSQQLDKVLSHSSVLLLALALGLLVTVITMLFKENKTIVVNKRMEEALRTERDRAQMYLDVAGVMFVALDADGKVTLVNKRGCEILGYDEEEVFGRSWFDSFLPQERIEKVKGIFQQLMTGEMEPVEYIENLIITRGGEKRDIAWHNTLLRDGGGNIIGTFSSGEDITERKRAEDTLRENEGRLKTILDSMQSGILIVDADKHVIVDVNPVAADLIGAPKEEIVGRVCHNFVCPAEKGKCPITDLGQTIDKSERVLLNVKGERIPILKTVTPTILHGRRHLIDSFMDITEHKRAQEDRVQREKLQGVIEMAGAVCHELNQPLQAVSGYSELLMGDVSEDNPLYGDIKKIKAEISRMGQITRKLMHITRYETKDYIEGAKIIDIDRASDKGRMNLGSNPGQLCQNHTMRPCEFGHALYIYSFEMMVIVLWCGAVAKVEDRRPGCAASHYRSWY